MSHNTTCPKPHISKVVVVLCYTTSKGEDGCIIIAFSIHNPVLPPCRVLSGCEVDAVELLHVELEAAGVLVARLADGALEPGAGPGLVLLPAPHVPPLLPMRVRFTWEQDGTLI